MKRPAARGHVETEDSDHGDLDKRDPLVVPVVPKKKVERAVAMVRLTDARKTIVSCQSTVASAKSMIETIKSDPDDDEAEYAWARTPAVLGKIQTLTSDLDTQVKQYTIWQQLFLGVEIAQVPEGGVRGADEISRGGSARRWGRGGGG